MQSKNSLVISISLLAFLSLVLQANSDIPQNWGLSKSIKRFESSSASSSVSRKFEIRNHEEGVQTDKPRPPKDTNYLVATIASGAGMIGGSHRHSSGSEVSFGSPKEIIHRDIQRAQIVAAQKSREFTLLGLKPSGVS
ncbi:MAG: hypothetical protein IIB00_01030 [candidate division Zixibacteria bacterium]|nr:hypothetical protein [candidate division Zixibacteria bacterium]